MDILLKWWMLPIDGASSTEGVRSTKLPRLVLFEHTRDLLNNPNFIQPWFQVKRIYKKKTVQIGQKKLQQNTVRLEQQIYASQDDFTQPLVVMVETFRRSGAHCHVSK